MDLNRSTSMKMRAWTLWSSSDCWTAVLEPLHQDPPVGQTGQAVVVAWWGHGVLERLALGYIPEVDDGTDRLPLCITADAV